MHDVLIVGGGHGGAQAAIALRQRGFAGSIAIVGEEPDLPYERPPLNKAYLAGDKPFDRILIRPARFWAERSIDLLLGRRAVAVDPAARSVRVEDGETLRYGTLVWSAGGHARRLACNGHDLSGVHTVRCRSDIDRLAAELAATARVAVVGAGYVGLEAAATLRKLGKAVVVLEAHDRVLARVTGTQLAAFLANEHRAHDVDVRTNVVVDGLVGTGSVAGVRLADGEVIAADMVIAGIGIVPAVAPLLEAGAEGGNGVLVDPLCRTSLPDIRAIGDCALHHNAFAATNPIRLESV